jgi:hypothetical protein
MDSFRAWSVAGLTLWANADRIGGLAAAVAVLLAIAVIAVLAYAAGRGRNG